YQCLSVEYVPVCGCDAVTYRNECAAQHWGGLLNTGWTQGICGNFDFDIYPTGLSSISSVLHFSYFVKTPGSLTLYVYDPFGRVKIQKDYYISDITNSMPTEVKEIPETGGLDRGIYFVVVVFEGDRLYKKIAMVK